MQGRKAFTPAIDKAADFIAAEFKAIGLQTWNNTGNYRQEFTMVTPKFVSASARTGWYSSRQESDSGGQHAT